MATLTEIPMKKQPVKEDESIPKTTTKVRTATLQKAKALAAIQGLDLFDYLDEILTPFVEREYTRRVKD